jgi:hypothetical protein
MVSQTQMLRIKSIQENASLVYGLSHDPIIASLLEQVALDIDWLCYNLQGAWSAVNAYQDELRQLQEKGM